MAVEKKRSLPSKVLWLSLFLSAVLACDRNAQEEASHAGTAILDVNGKRYDLEEFNFYLALTYPEIDKEGDPELLSHALDKFKREIVMAELANFSGYFVSEDQISDFIENKMTTMSFHLKSNQERAFWQKILRRRLAIQELLQNETLRGAVVSDQAIQNYYQTHQQDYQGETLYQLRIVQIADLDKAKALRKALKSSREPFAKTVSEYAANDGYRIVETFPIEGLIPPFQNAIKGMRPGQYSKPIPVKQGELTVYYLLSLEAIFPAKPVSYEEAHYDIHNKLHKVEAERLLETQLSQFLERLPVTQLDHHLPFRYIEPNKRSENQ